jgi:hypothetical protein
MIIIPQDPESTTNLWRPPAEPTRLRPRWMIGGAVAALCLALVLGTVLTYHFVHPFVSLFDRM